VNGADVDVFLPDETFTWDFFWPNAAQRPWTPVNVPVGQFFDPYRNVAPIAAPEIFPSVYVLPSPADARDSDSATPGDQEISVPSPADVVDPAVGQTTTVYEDAPGGIYETDRAPTDWDAVYEQYVILNAPEADVPFHSDIDWGTIAGNVIGGIFDPFGAGAATTSYFNPQPIVGGMQTVPQMGGPPGVQAMTPMTPTGAGCPPLGPKYAKICLATREITPLRRRRRRRLLTSSDIKDLAALKAIVGGAALQGAVVQAIRR